MTSQHYTDDASLFALMKSELFTAVVGDVMDVMGLRRQFLPPEIKALKSSMVLAGRAMTVLEADFPSSEDSTGQGPLAGKPFGMMLEALDDLKAGEIYIASGSSGTYALWGELMTARAKHLGATGAVLNGFSRDTNGILKQDFPVFSTGCYAQDQGVRGKVVDWRLSIDVGEARVNTGDLLFGDVDGVLVVPRHAEREVIARALEKVRGEHIVADAIRDGMGAVEAFKTYGIL